MTEAEEQEVFARLERLERSNWRWKALATVLGVIFLLLLSLGVVSAVAFRARQTVQFRLAVEEEQRARIAAEEQRRAEAAAQAAARQGTVKEMKRMPREPGPGEVP